MTTRTIGIIVHGATGRIGSTQHLANCLVPIRDEGGLQVGADRVVPRLMLVGRTRDKLEPLAAKLGAEWSTDLDRVLADPAYAVFCDTAATALRPAILRKALAAGKHAYCEKPLAPSVAEGIELLALAEASGLRHGAVEDKLYLPGLQKLTRLVERGFFGRIVGFRLEFGWWVFDGTEVACQRPSWNYKKSSGGGMLFDMYPHWRYVIEGLLGPIRRVVAAASTATPQRIDEHGARYAVDVEDNAHALVELDNGAIGTVLSSWATRVRRDDLVTFQIDGTRGSALAGLHRCFTQTSAEAPSIAHVSVAVDAGIDYRQHWREDTDPVSAKNPYRFGWENFLRHVHAGEPMRADFAAGIRDVQLAEACHRSLRDGAWVGLERIA